MSKTDPRQIAFAKEEFERRANARDKELKTDSGRQRLQMIINEILQYEQQ